MILDPIIPTACLYCFLGKPKFLLGYATGGFGFLTDQTRNWQEGIHESEHFINLLRILKPDLRRVEANLDYLAAENEAKQLLHENEIPKLQSYVVIHAFCSQSFLSDFKQWNRSEWKKNY